MNYSHMIDTGRNSDKSFHGIKRGFYRQPNARNTSMIQISKTNLDVS